MYFFHKERYKILLVYQFILKLKCFPQLNRSIIFNYSFQGEDSQVGFVSSQQLKINCNQLSAGTKLTTGKEEFHNFYEETADEENYEINLNYFELHFHSPAMDFCLVSSPLRIFLLCRRCQLSLRLSDLLPAGTMIEPV